VAPIFEESYAHPHTGTKFRMVTKLHDGRVFIGWPRPQPNGWDPRYKYFLWLLSVCL